MNQLRNFWLPSFCILAVVVSLWLGWNGKIQPLNDGPYDSLRFLGMAESITGGDWLGSYNFLTLIRQPTYSLFSALNGWLGLPLHITQQAAYLLALALLVLALCHCRIAAWKAGIFFALGAFHPMAFYPHMFIIPEALYTTATMGVMAGCMGIWGVMDRDRPVFFMFWLMVLSAFLPLLWHMRGESIWILPALVLFFWICAKKIRRSGHASVLRSSILRPSARMRFIYLILFPALTTMLVGMVFIAMNKAHYGTSVIYELTEPAFARTGELLTHIEAGSRAPRVPVSHAALDVAYTASPTMALLKPYFDRQTAGYGWVSAGCEVFGICNEIVAGWSLWALRDAANAIGAYQSATGAHDFYARIVNELDEACKNDHISCSENPTGNLLYPPLTLDDVPLVTVAFVKVVKQFLSFGILESELKAIGKIPANPALVARYDVITHDQHGVSVDKLLIPVHSLLWIYQVLQWLGIIWLGISLVWLVWNKLGNRGSNNATPDIQKTIVIFMVLIIVSRLGLFALLDAISWMALPRYLLCAYPAFLLLCVMALPARFMFAKPAKK